MIKYNTIMVAKRFPFGHFRKMRDVPAMEKNRWHGIKRTVRYIRTYACIYETVKAGTGK